MVQVRVFQTLTSQVVVPLCGGSAGLLPPPGLQSSLGARRIMGGGSSPRALKSTYASGSRRQRSYRKHGRHKMQGKHRRQRRYRRHRLGLRDQPLRLLAVSTILQREIERLHSTMRLFHIVRVGHGGYDKKQSHLWAFEPSCGEYTKTSEPFDE